MCLFEMNKQRPLKDPHIADALQFSMFDALPSYVGKAVAFPNLPSPSAPPPTESVRVGDWVVLKATDKFARDFGYAGGHVEALVAAPCPVPGVLLAYAHREATPDRWTHLLGGCRTPHAFENIAEVWRCTDGAWSKV